MHEEIILETINVSSVVANALSIWQRKAHIQLLQETLVPPGAAWKQKQEAKEFGKTLEVGPLDPEQNKVAIKWRRELEW